MDWYDSRFGCERSRVRFSECPFYFGHGYFRCQFRIEGEIGDERVKKEAMEIIAELEVLPRLVVFHLDYTLWPFYFECLSMCDMPSLYLHAKGILHALKDKGIGIAVASRSPTPDKANTFLEKLGIKSFFVAQEIFSSWTHKTDHFQKLKQRTGVPYNEMLFFDDEDHNIQAVSKMGVTSILVDDGVDLGALRQGHIKFSQSRSALEKNKQRWRKFSQKPTSSENQQ
ncbi:magnesium-dependent phosphatase 1-like [Salvia splendens]|uniref:magnesium-dependent phosphatase 1-like n=1 Tax=Salvia splendens TaxID=180675 RepID=UPI001C26372F|nr:magnesium-dependent phosphatase 1-like [Salvia splendens]